MLGERYDRHRRDRSERFGDYAASGGRLIPKRPIVWLLVKLWRALIWAVRSLVYGMAALTHSTAGRVALFAVATSMLLDASFGADAVTVPIIGALGWPLLGAFGAWVYRRRRGWEERVANRVYHILPGHSRVEPEVVWFGNKANLGRWTGSRDFGFRTPAAVREADLPDITEHLRDSLPADPSASWLVLWDLRRGEARAKLVPNAPWSLTRAELLERIVGAGDTLDRDRVPLGVSVDGVEVWDVEKDPHVLSVGKTGKGKSVAQLGVCCHALEQGWELVACDPKRVEMRHLEGYSSVRLVARELPDIVAAIEGAAREMRERYKVMDAAGVVHIRDLDPNARRLLVVVDELAQVTMLSNLKDEESKAQDELRRRAMRALEDVAALGRAAAVNLYLSTQRPDVALGILSGPLKHNLTARLAVGKMDVTASGMALDSDAAAQLPALPKGRAIWQGIEGEKRVQIAFTKESDLPPKGEVPA